MGLTIFYSGTLRGVQQLTPLVNEVSDICDGLHWPSAIIEPTHDFPITGISFCPPGSEEIWLTFMSDGRMADPDHFIVERFNPTIKRKSDEVILIDSIVQYAGPDMHMEMIKLMRYVTTKYFSSFQMLDESEYWETGNVEKCRDWYAMFEVWMNNMSEDLGKLDGRGYEGGQHFQERLKDLCMNGKSMVDIIKAMGNPYR